VRILTVPRLVFAIAAAVIAASMIAGFRGEDWFNIERGANSLADLPATLLATHTPGFYRPLPDLVTGVMYRSFGLTPAPYIALLLLLFAIDAGLLAAIVRARGGTPAAAWIAVAALAVQCNTYAWTVYWFSYVTGSLVTTFLLLAIWLHHRAVARAGTGGGSGPSIAGAALALALAALCKEELVLLPAIVAALEAARWRRLAIAERRVAIASFGVLVLVVAAYAGFRWTVHPPSFDQGSARYQLAFGRNWISNLVFFGFHLLPLPVVMAVAGWIASRRTGAPGRTPEPATSSPVRAELAAGAAWALLAIQLYLPMRGHAYGLLYLPAFGVALGLAPWLATVERPARRLALYGVFAVLATAWGLAGAGWPRYQAIARATFASLDQASPSPPQGGRFVFLDPMERETLSGRSLFNMAFDGAVASMVRLHYRRPDLDARLVIGPAALDSAVHPPLATAVFLVRGGRLERVDRGAQVAKRPVR
jgi:hypothetical protein